MAGNTSPTAAGVGASPRDSNPCQAAREPRLLKSEAQGSSTALLNLQARSRQGLSRPQAGAKGPGTGGHQAQPSGKSRGGGDGQPN